MMAVSPKLAREPDLGGHRDARGGPFPLPPSAELLWEFMTALYPEDPAGAREVAMQSRRLCGTLDIHAFTRAVSDISQRHDALRIRFDSTGLDPAVRVAPEIEPPLAIIDLTGLSAHAQRDQLARLAHRERYRAFDLRHGPLWQACLVRLSDVEHVLTTSFSHIIADGWSGRLFAEEVLRAYRARMNQGPPLPALDADLRDIIQLQFNELAPTPDRAAYWRRQLSPPVRYLPFEPMTPAADADLILEASHRFSLPADTHRMLRQVAWRAKTTPYLVLMAAYHILISLRTQTDRIIISTTTLGRGNSMAKRLIGQFTNDVCLAVTIRKHDPLLSVIAQVHEAVENAVRNVMSYKHLATAVNPRFTQCRPWPDNHLFDSYFQAATPAAADLTWDELRVEEIWIDGQRPPGALPELTVSDVRPQCLPIWIKRGSPIVIVDDDRRGGVMVYNPSFFASDLIRSLVRDYLSIVNAIARDPSISVAAVGRVPAG